MLGFVIKRATTSLRLRGEVGRRAQRGFRVRGSPVANCGSRPVANRPLTPTLSPQAGRGGLQLFYPPAARG